MERQDARQSDWENCGWRGEYAGSFFLRSLRSAGCLYCCSPKVQRQSHSQSRHLLNPPTNERVPLGPVGVKQVPGVWPDMWVFWLGWLEAWMAVGRSAGCIDGRLILLIWTGLLTTPNALINPSTNPTALPLHFLLSLR